MNTGHERGSRSFVRALTADAVATRVVAERLRARTGNTDRRRVARHLVPRRRAIARRLDGWSVVAPHCLRRFDRALLRRGVLLPKEHLTSSVHGSALFEDEIKADIFEIRETHPVSPTGSTDITPRTSRRSSSSLRSKIRWSTVALLGEVLFWSLQLPKLNVMAKPPAPAAPPPRRIRRPETRGGGKRQQAAPLDPTLLTERSLIEVRRRVSWTRVLVRSCESDREVAAFF